MIKKKTRKPLFFLQCVFQRYIPRKFSKGKKKKTEKTNKLNRKRRITTRLSSHRYIYRIVGSILKRTTDPKERIIHFILLFF